jgi:hypothetical protein
MDGTLHIPNPVVFLVTTYIAFTSAIFLPVGLRFRSVVAVGNRISDTPRNPHLRL